MTVAKRGAHTKFSAVEIAGESDYELQTYGLGDARDNEALSLSGSSLTIFKLAGTCSIRFDGTAHSSIPLETLDYPSMIVFDRDFINIYLTNSSQAGTLILYTGKKE